MRPRIFIDRGGTFTDCIAVLPSGERRIAKVLSSDRAPIEGIRTLLRLRADEPVPACDIRMGTTLATNALLERKGARTALMITEGFGDLMRIGDQTRPDLFSLEIRKPEPPVSEVIELGARTDAHGQVLLRPEPNEVRNALVAAKQRGIESLAVVFMHAHVNGALEQEIAAMAREVGFRHISLSHEVGGEIGLLARAGTTVLDAYLTPVLADYVAVLQRELPGSSLSFMQSSGGLVDAGQFRGRDAVLSGPAGGIVACAELSRTLGLPQVIGFDMGGTSTDVSRYAGDLDRRYETRIDGLTLRAPSLRIHTVAAGGGSLCWYDGQRFRVGPQSAGALPGPLCYGHPDARDLSLTDVNLALGRILPEHFPLPLHRGRVDAALNTVTATLARDGDARSPLEVADGFFSVAVEHMAEAIRRVSLAEGHDPREHALIVFGGAGGQHACAVARKLGIRKLIVHPLAGLLSAHGIGAADVAWHKEVDADDMTLTETLPHRLYERFDTLLRDGQEALATHKRGAALRVTRRVDLRYTGTQSALTLPLEPEHTLAIRFEREHRQRYGYARPDHEVEITALRVEVVAPSKQPTHSSIRAAHSEALPPTTSRLWLAGRFVEARVYTREALPTTPIAGPALVIDQGATLVIEPGFVASQTPGGCLLVEDLTQAAPEPPSATRRDPVLLEVFASQFMSIAEQMGVTLQRTALSTNIRERMDFSCAVFDPRGELVANAPHIPVHLGAMSESVRAVMAMHPALEHGDVFATNDPALGGSHLPDITVITPVFDEHGKLAYFTASRGHHSDVGGISPGSMPPFSAWLDDEGVVLRGLRIVHRGVLDEPLVRAALSAGPHPARDIDQNLADLEAQIAANQKGAELLRALSQRFGADTTAAYMGHVLDDAQAKVEAAIQALEDGEYTFRDALDDGTTIQVRLRVNGARMTVDFTGSSAEVAGNLNAPHAVTKAAVLYVLRALVGTPIPLNNGCLRPIELIIPERSVLAPSPGRAVVAGNVETSQRVVDVLLGALGRLAACQGTMNNFTFGDDTFGYYETIAGGAGAGPGFHGASGVHTHMTNTRITDPEVLERRYPVRLWRFALRRGSGGAGRFHGGDGVVREIEALRPLACSILSERRVLQPFGLAGGGAGQVGRNCLGDALLPGKASFEVRAGQRIRIETPGGGGHGTP
jgi:5-oxoprolinase (ATP-hydrolysing)